MNKRHLKVFDCIHLLGGKYVIFHIMMSQCFPNSYHSVDAHFFTRLLTSTAIPPYLVFGVGGGCVG